MPGLPRCRCSLLSSETGSPASVSNALVEGVTPQSGFLDVLSPASPAAGANFSFTTGGLNVSLVRVVSCIATVTTDANVASRFLSLDFINGPAKTCIRNAAVSLFTANTAATVVQWDQAHMVSDWNTGTMLFAPLVNLYLSPGWTVQLTLDNKQAGDTLTALTFVLEKFWPDTLNADDV